MELRGRVIEEMSRDELIALHAQIDAELPDDLEQLSNAHVPKLHELETIEDELERRNERL
jgi:hypothetical protein